MDRVFLDANVLFSAAYRMSSRIRALWDLPNTELMSSEYAVEEARRNIVLSKPDCVAELDSLVDQLTVISSAGHDLVPADVVLADKDRPILAAAIECKATHLLTGDLAHFGRLFGERVGGVLITTPSRYLCAREIRALEGAFPGLSAEDIREDTDRF